MKKMFLAAITALALCSYSYAQDDEDEYEEEETTEAVKPAPAVEDEEEEAAPAPKKAKKEKKKKKSSDGDGSGFLGLSIGLDQNEVIDFEDETLIGSFSYLGIMFKITPEMMLTAKFGLGHHGETTMSPSEGADVDQEDDFTAILFGAQFDYFLPTPLLPTSVSAGFMYGSGGERNTSWNGIAAKETPSAILIDIMFNAHASLVDNLVLTGSVGFGIEMVSDEYKSADPDVPGSVEYSRTNTGIKAGISLGWFFM